MRSEEKQEAEQGVEELSNPSVSFTVFGMLQKMQEQIFL